MDTINELETRPPGYDPEDPYQDRDLSNLPDWWQNAVVHFEKHDLRPYRPPRFEDGELKHEIINPIEDELDVAIGCIYFPRYNDENWIVLLDGKKICEIGHRREPAGYSVFELTSSEFEQVVYDEVERPD